MADDSEDLRARTRCLRDMLPCTQHSPKRATRCPKRDQHRDQGASCSCSSSRRLRAPAIMPSHRAHTHITHSTKRRSAAAARPRRAPTSRRRWCTCPTRTTQTTRVSTHAPRNTRSPHAPLRRARTARQRRRPFRTRTIHCRSAHKSVGDTQRDTLVPLCTRGRCCSRNRRFSDRMSARARLIT
jgi:hypothetical protein